jgi:hypothetical protein
MYLTLTTTDIMTYKPIEVRLCKSGVKIRKTSQTSSSGK